MTLQEAEIDRLRYACVAAGLHHTVLIRHHRMRCDSDDWEASKPSIISYPCSKGEPILRTELYVEQNDLWRTHFKCVECFSQICRSLLSLIHI